VGDPQLVSQHFYVVIEAVHLQLPADLREGSTNRVDAEGGRHNGHHEEEGHEPFHPAHVASLGVD